MKKLRNFCQPIFTLTIAFFLSATAMAQLTKSEVPSGILNEIKANTPRQLEFKGDKLILNTDPTKTTGRQYKVEYTVTWKGNKFDLKSVEEVITEINEDGESETTTIKNSDFFGYSYLKNWSLTKEGGNYVLRSDATKDYWWVFK